MSDVGLEIINQRVNTCVKCEHFARPMSCSKIPNLRDAIKFEPVGPCPLGLHASATDAAGGESLAAKVIHGAAGLAKAAMGIDAVPADVEAHRLEVCGACEKNVAGIFGRYCNGCGCYIAAKVKIGAEKCPAAKWEPHATTGEKRCGGCGDRDLP